MGSPPDEPPENHKTLLVYLLSRSVIAMSSVQQKVFETVLSNQVALHFDQGGLEILQVRLIEIDLGRSQFLINYPHQTHHVEE